MVIIRLVLSATAWHQQFCSSHIMIFEYVQCHLVVCDFFSPMFTHRGLIQYLKEGGHDSWPDSYLQLPASYSPCHQLPITHIPSCLALQQYPSEISQMKVSRRNVPNERFQLGPGLGPNVSVRMIGPRSHQDAQPTCAEKVGWSFFLTQGWLIFI